MRTFQKLYEEMQLGEKPDMTARLMGAVALLLGSFRRRLPAHELTGAEFLQVFIPGHFEKLDDFLAKHTARSLPWKLLKPEQVPEDAVALADDAVAQKFSFLGQDFHFHEAVDWRHSLGPGGPWPPVHWSEMQFQDIAHLDDIKPCWEMNRHQFFVTLALAWIKTGDAKYAETVKKFLHGWCDQNTPETGVNYISGLDIGLRCVSWIFADRLLRGCPAWDAATQERLHRNVWSQARHIAEYLSYSGKTAGGSHLLCEAAVLAWIALQYPEWQDSEKWQRRALSVLWPALDAQVTPDGLHFEGAPCYHLQVVEALLLLFTEMRRQKKPVPSKAYFILQKMGFALRLTRVPGGDIPNINDCDDGFVLPLPLSRPERAQAALAVLSALYDRPDFKASAQGRYGLFGQLLLGEAGADDFRIVATTPDEFPFLTQLREGGLYMLRKKSDFLLLKNNPDPFPLSGHNHADLLNVLLYFDGKPVLVDAGTYRYSDDRGLRNALRGTAAHNTITVDNCGQAEPLRNFDWSSSLKPGAAHALDEDGAAVIDAANESFHGLNVTHRRVVVWLKAEDIVLVIDQLQGNDTHSFEQYWHFPPGTRVEDAGPFQYRLSKGAEALAFLRFLRNKDLDRHETIAGGDANPAFMFSPAYGTVESGIAVKHSWMSTLKGDHSSHRIAMFTKKETAVEFSDVWHAEFRLNNWNIDLNQTPAKVAKVKG